MVTMTTADTGALLIDSAMPTYDAAIAEHIIVAADPAKTFASARGLDLLTVHSPLLDVSMWLRELPARLSGTTAPRIPNLVIGEGMGLPGWMFLGQTARSPSALSVDSGSPLSSGAMSPQPTSVASTNAAGARSPRTSLSCATVPLRRCLLTNAEQ
jgi:hypothetical protein